MKNERVMVMVAVCVSALAAVAVGCRSDIRPDALRGIEQPSAGAEQRGRAMLARAAQVHGAEAFRAHEAYTMTVRDEWRGMATMLNPWPADEVHVELSFRSNTFDARARFLEGDLSGSVWGMQSWRTYEEVPGKARRFVDNDDARFILPAIQYLAEFVFRDHSGQVVAALDPIEIDGARYERVFLTWSSLEPSDDHDQYIVYLEPKTGRVAKIEYTVRDMMSMATGAIHFEEYARVEGVLVPMRQSVTFAAVDSPDSYAHRITVERVMFGEPGVDAFVVDDGLDALGDEKVSMSQ